MMVLGIYLLGVVFAWIFIMLSGSLLMHYEGESLTKIKESFKEAPTVLELLQIIGICAFSWATVLLALILIAISGAEHFFTTEKVKTFLNRKLW